MALVFGVLLAAVMARVVALEWTYGDAYRAEAQQPIERRQRLPAQRGRILAADGTVLACDEQAAALAVQYRWLESPPNEQWLAKLARARTPRSQWREPGRLAAASQAVVAERAALRERLTALCGISTAEFTARALDVQAHVERISKRVNERRQAQAASHRQAAQPPANEKWWQATARVVVEALAATDDEPIPSHITIAEELEAHVMFESVSPQVVAEIEAHPELYPGTRIASLTRRTYPNGSLAAHAVGHLGLVTEQELADSQAGYKATDRPGRLGLERQHEATLRGSAGLAIEQTDHGGRLLRTVREREPVAGRDVQLTLDLRAQRAAEMSLDEAVAKAGQPNAGGAIVVLDVQSGAVRVAASAPRFDPNLLAGFGTSDAARLLNDPAKPVFDRTHRMAIPPGSVFKTLTAIALLEEDVVRPDEPFHCRGYLQQPDRLRCQIYRRWSVGHGPTTLDSALAWSCNVYFFHHATTLGPDALVAWSRRFGFGVPTGVDLPGESAGRVPTPASAGEAWTPADTQALAIGQSGLQVTPLQIARLMAVVANGGRLVNPHVVSVGSDSPGSDAQVLREGSTLSAVRRGLERVVADPEGTANRTVFLDGLSIAGKTGTAETGGGRPDHAWFAGYAPADRPQVAFVVVLEHAGSGAESAGPVARQLVATLLGD